jgi:hypothetical protein
MSRYTKRIAVEFQHEAELADGGRAVYAERKIVASHSVEYAAVCSARAYGFSAGPDGRLGGMIVTRASAGWIHRFPQQSFTDWPGVHGWREDAGGIVTHRHGEAAPSIGSCILRGTIKVPESSVGGKSIP